MTKHLLIVCLSLCVFGAGSSAVEAKKAKTYKIMGDQKKGTKFRHIEAESPIPFDKNYDELSDEHKKIYRRLYKVLTERALEETENPPFPAKGLRKLYKPLIRKNKLVAKNGIVFFVALIDEEGVSEKVTVYQSPNREFTEFVNILMFTTKFNPGTCDGTPCKMEFPFEMDLRYVQRNSDIKGNVGVEAPSLGPP